MYNSTGKRIKFGRAGLDYIYKEDAHDESMLRNQHITELNCVDGVDVYSQFQYCWDYADERHETQLRHFIISFSENEFDPNNSNDVAQAHLLAEELAEKLWGPDVPRPRQVIVATQIDNGTIVKDENGEEKLEGAHIHTHFMVNDCDMANSYGFTEKERSKGWFRKQAEPFFKEKFKELGIEYDYGKKNAQRMSQYERVIGLDKFDARLAVLAAREDAIKEDDNERVSNYDAWLKKNKYSYIEHIKHNVNKAYSEASSYADFKQKLDENGIIYDDSKMHNKFTLREDEYHKYTDEPYTAKAHKRGRNISKDGEFTKENLMAHFEEMNKTSQKTVKSQPKMKQEEQQEPQSSYKGLDWSSFNDIKYEKASIRTAADAVVAAKTNEIDTKLKKLKEELNMQMHPEKYRGKQPEAEPTEEVVDDEVTEPEIVQVVLPVEEPEEEIIDDEDEDEELEFEDEQLAAQGFGVQIEKQEEQVSAEKELSILEKMRAKIAAVRSKGEAIEDEENEDGGYKEFN